MASEKSNTHTVPCVNLLDWQKDRAHRQMLVDQVGDACHQHGFFYLTGYAMPANLISRYFTHIHQFFALPNQQKEPIAKWRSPQYRGWDQLGAELTNNETDYREQLDIGPEREVVAQPDPFYLRLVGPNQWPDESLCPGFRQCVTDYLNSMQKIADTLLQVMSTSLGLDQNALGSAFGEKPSPYLKLIRYPVSEEKTQGVGTHKDSGFLTLLMQDDAGGLQAQSVDGTWYDIPPKADSLVVNVGELMQMITQNYFIAAPHRVSSPPVKSRFSSAYFYSPDLNTPLNPLPVSDNVLQAVSDSHYHRSAGFMASRKEINDGLDSMGSSRRTAVFGERYWERWARSYPDITARYYPDD